ncbi:MAG: S23 ribosomal protein [Ignavibacteria bacterium]|nr:MAG: S23 ribosomal protein [Ignavibacteria bacterium]KAF0160331.1 MAG: S23 ribosomal protein [Ignavibacteria bacterium]
MIRSYKDLIVWQKSMDLAEAIYLIIESLPSSENYGIKSQIRRAAVSIPSNIAEGYGRQSSGSYKQFLLIERGSLLELETQIELCVRLKYLDKSSISNLEINVTEGHL